MKKPSPVKPGRAAKALPVAAPPPAAGGWRRWWAGCFAVDPRSLAAFRMVAGLLLLADLAVRAADLTAMYTDAGMFPRMEIVRRYTTMWNWSFHFGGGSAAYQTLLLGLAGGLGLALLLGCQTRLATIGSWLLLLSLHHRVPPILSGAEVLLRMLLFWGMFLPLGRVWSLDAWLARRRGGLPAAGAGGPVFSVATAALLLQMALMYLFSAISKTNAVWLRGEALAGIMAHDFYATGPATWLLAFPRLLAGLTWLVLGLEWLAPFLLLATRGPWRAGVVALMAAMHLGIALFLQVGLFSFVSLAGLVVFLPAWFWEHSWLRRPVAAGVSAPPAPGPWRDALHPAARAVCAAALAYVIAVNLGGLPGRPFGPHGPDTWRPIAIAGGLGQKWNMFEHVPSRDGWYVARARLRDGSEVDLLRNGAPVSWERPAAPLAVFPNYHWKKVFREMAYADELGYHVFRQPVAQYLIREWNRRQPPEQQVVEFEFIYCSETANAPGDGGRVERERLLQLDLVSS